MTNARNDFPLISVGLAIRREERAIKLLSPYVDQDVIMDRLWNIARLRAREERIMRSATNAQ